MIHTNTAIGNLLPVQLVTVFLIKEVVKPPDTWGRNQITICVVVTAPLCGQSVLMHAIRIMYSDVYDGRFQKGVQFTAQLELLCYSCGIIGTSSAIISKTASHFIALFFNGVTVRRMQTNRNAYQTLWQSSSHFSTCNIWHDAIDTMLWVVPVSLMQLSNASHCFLTSLSMCTLPADYFDLL